MKTVPCPTRSFDDALESSKGLISESPILELHQEPLSDQFAHQSNDERGIDLYSEDWQVHHHGKPFASLRFARILSPKLDMFLIFIFPQCPWGTPVFAAEFISILGEVKLGFIDLQTPGFNPECQSSLQRHLEPIRGRYPLLQSGHQAPDWATCDSSGAPIYTRPEPNIEILECLNNAYQDYLGAWIDSLPSVTSDLQDNPQKDSAERLRAYKNNQIEHSPGTPFLNGAFGEEWTRRFQSEFLYR